MANYYISKPKSHKLNEAITDGIKKLDKEAVIVDTLEEADICIFQSGWTKSKKCVLEHHTARDKHIKCREGYLYTDYYCAKLN